MHLNNMKTSIIVLISDMLEFTENQKAKHRRKCYNVKS